MPNPHKGLPISEAVRFGWKTVQSSFAFIHPVRPHYSTLLKFDTANYPKVVGDLAESWTVSPVGLTYTFKLRRNVKIHDNTPMTS